jgi:hypothetical protein
MAVMNNFMADINRRTEFFQRPFDNQHGTVNTGAKTARRGKKQFHFRLLP